VISFETKSDQNRTKWHNVILEARYPSLSFSYHDEDHQKIWDLFDRSGYLDEKPREAFTHVFDITKLTWRKLSDAGTKISKRAIIKFNDSIVGHLQIDRIYPDTWCAHQLAVDPKVSKMVGKEIYSVTADVLMAEGAKYVISFAQATKPWNQRNYYEFVKQYPFAAHNELKTFQFFGVDTRLGCKLSTCPDLKLRLASKEDYSEIENYFHAYGSELERKACGLDSDHLDLSNLNSEFSDFGLSRGRDFILGIMDNKVVGFARVETGTSGINIFGLLDVLYVHLMPGLGKKAPEISEALVLIGLKRFRDLGITDVLVALDDQRPKYYADKGLPFIANGTRWIGRCAIVRRYHVYTQMMYGHLLLKREKIRNRKKQAKLS